MTVTIEAPSVQKPANGIQSVELELTGTCQLECAHCCTLSGPKVSHGAMTFSDWRAVVDDIAKLRIPAVQFIGGEVTLSPHLVPLIGRALEQGLAVEVFSNLSHVRPGQWSAFEQQGVRLATSYYSDDPEQHDAITGGRGSHARTRANIVETLRRGIPLRVGIVDVRDGQRIAEAEAELRSLGVRSIRVDRVRKVGRANGESEAAPKLSELCGRCFHQRAAVSPDGDVYGCILSRFLPTGNVREKGLVAVMGGAQWRAASAVVRPAAPVGCVSEDGSDCGPASTPACNPAY